MELRELRSLAALADLGSIARTADKLHLSPPAIFKQLKVLESDLGVQLYERVGRRLRLTQAADVLLPYVKDLLAQYDAALAALGEWKGLRKGSVRLGTGPAMSSYVLPPLLRRFRHRCPNVDLFIETGNTTYLLENLSKGSMDLALVISPNLAEGPSIRVEASWDFEIVLVTGHQQVPRRCQLRDLQPFPFILYKKGSRMGESVDGYLAGARFEPRVIMRFDNAESIKAMVRSGLGISMLPMWTLGADLSQGKLSLIRQRERPLISKIALLSRQPNYIPQPVKAFIESAREFKYKSPRLMSS